MKKEKDYFVPSQAKVIEIFEMFAALKFPDKKSAAFKKMREKYLNEYITEAVLPAGSEYAQNPKIADSTMSEFPDLFGTESIIAKTLGPYDLDKPDSQTVRATRELRGIVTQLTHLYMSTRLKNKIRGTYEDKQYENSDFEFPADADENTQKAVLVNRYIRLLIFSALMQAIEPVFKVSLGEINDFISDSGMKNDSIAHLKDKNVRSEFIKGIRSFFKQRFGSESAIKGIFKTKKES